MIEPCVLARSFPSRLGDIHSLPPQNAHKKGNCCCSGHRILTDTMAAMSRLERKTQMFLRTGEARRTELLGRVKKNKS
eukprot:scaffold4232_cov215-Amphora_coffeaeformis.AAC.8